MIKKKIKGEKPQNSERSRNHQVPNGQNKRITSYIPLTYSEDRRIGTS